MENNESEEKRRALLTISAYLITVASAAAVIYASPHYWKQDYHTSALTGEAWVQELIHGHPDRICTELGVRLHIFLALVFTLRTKCGLTDSKYIQLEEQVAIFLYMSVTGLSIRHVGERFQRSNETISKYILFFILFYLDEFFVHCYGRYFILIMNALSSPEFYNEYVKLPEARASTPQFIRSNPKYSPFFDMALGAIDGTHINCCPSTAERQTSRNRKGGLSQNCLACTSFDLRFLYFVSGWEGSAADASLYADARFTDLKIPNGKFYLADAGFGACDHLLVPYRGVRYHLAEWGAANIW